MQTNLGSYFDLQCDNESDADCVIVIAFFACIFGFHAGCRPFIFLDGMHIKSKYKGVLLAANGVNGENGIYPLAFAIVDSETVNARSRKSGPEGVRTGGGTSRIVTRRRKAKIRQK